MATAEFGTTTFGSLASDTVDASTIHNLVDDATAAGSSNILYNQILDANVAVDAGATLRVNSDGAYWIEARDEPEEDPVFDNLGDYLLYKYNNVHSVERKVVEPEPQPDPQVTVRELQSDVNELRDYQRQREERQRAQELQPMFTYTPDRVAVASGRRTGKSHFMDAMCYAMAALGKSVMKIGGRDERN